MVDWLAPAGSTGLWGRATSWRGAGAGPGLGTVGSTWVVQARGGVQAGAGQASARQAGACYYSRLVEVLSTAKTERI